MQSPSTLLQWRYPYLLITFHILIFFHLLLNWFLLHPENNSSRSSDFIQSHHLNNQPSVHNFSYASTSLFFQRTQLSSQHLFSTIDTNKKLLWYQKWCRIHLYFSLNHKVHEKYFTFFLSWACWKHSHHNFQSSWQILASKLIFCS